MASAQQAEAEATAARKAAEAELVQVYRETAPPQVAQGVVAPDPGTVLASLIAQLGTALQTIAQDAAAIPPTSLAALRSLEALLPGTRPEETLPVTRVPAPPPLTPSQPETGSEVGAPATEAAAKAAAEAAAAAAAAAIDQLRAAADDAPGGSPATPGEEAVPPAKNPAPGGSSHSFSPSGQSEKRARVMGPGEESPEEAARRLAEAAAKAELDANM